MVNKFTITVDGRVYSLKLTYGINSIERADINELGTVIDSDLPQVFLLNFDNIATYLKQFDTTGDIIT